MIKHNFAVQFGENFVTDFLLLLKCCHKELFLYFTIGKMQDNVFIL